jgi:hypothetical protein
MEKWKSTLDRMEYLEADIIGLCEASVNWSKNSATKNYNDVLQKNSNRQV